MKTLREYLTWAEEERVALGHFNISDSEGFKAVVEEAKKLNVPVIIGVSEGERDFIGISEVVALVKAERARGLPVFLNADHTYSVEKVKLAIDAGFDAVIIDGAAKSLEENVAITHECVSYAKSKGSGVVVEAGLFEIKPKLVIFPKNRDDLKTLVKWIGEIPGHSVTVRAAGSDMTGGPLNESIIADVSQHMRSEERIIG